MGAIQELLAFLQGVFEMIAASSAATILSIVGLSLLVLCGVLSYVAIKSEPGQVSALTKSSLFVALIGGMIFSAAGPAVALWDRAIFRPIGPEAAIKNLEVNKRTNYVIRLIAYNPAARPELGIGRLDKLGPADQLYSFVSSYDELAGYTVTEALEKVGQTYMSGHHVSAIIFPLQVDLFPANARGLLQIIKKVEDSTSPTARFLRADSLNNDEWRGLDGNLIQSYRIESFVGNYRRYCTLARQFKCDLPYPARSLIGGLQRDWHPLGFSQRNPQSDPCSIPVENYCDFSGWDRVKRMHRNDFGSRVFLIENLEIRNIPGRILIDFDSPDRQKIPEIGVR